MEKQTHPDNQAGFFSDELISDLQLIIKRLFNKDVEGATAQLIGLRIVEFAFIKEKLQDEEKTL